MNRGVAGLLRKYAVATEMPYRLLKKAWNDLPAAQRHAARLQLAAAVKAPAKEEPAP